MIPYLTNECCDEDAVYQAYDSRIYATIFYKSQYDSAYQHISSGLHSFLRFKIYDEVADSRYKQFVHTALKKLELNQEK